MSILILVADVGNFFLPWITHPRYILRAHVFHYKSGNDRESNKKNIVCYMELLPSMSLILDTYASKSMGITRGQIYSLSHESIWISQLLIKVKNSSKYQKNHHDKLIWDIITFQSSVFHSINLKSDHILFFIPLYS